MANRTVFVFWGQSNNMAQGVDGFVVPSIWATPDPNIKIWNTTSNAIETYLPGVNSSTITAGFPEKWGPELPFCRYYLADHPTEIVYILKYAIGGTALGPTPPDPAWLPSLAELFPLLTTELDALKAAIVALGDTPIVRAIIGMQGERDTNNGTNSLNYGTNKAAFYVSARALWGDTNTRFIDGRISNAEIGLAPTVNRNLVREGQLLAASSEQNAILVDTDGLPRIADDLHYSAAAIPLLGQHFYDAYRVTNPASVLVLFPTGSSMSSSNRTQLTSVVESTLGTTPTTPRMRTRRLTGESLFHRPTFVEQAEIRADRMVGDPIQTGTEDGGGVNFDLYLPSASGPLDVDIQSAFYNTWTLMPTRFNDGTADSVITDVANSGQVITVTTGAIFRVQTLVRNTGFTTAANNGLFRVTTSSATVPAFSGTAMVNEAAPPATARMKVVGFASPGTDDIVAVSNGLTSTVTTFNNKDLAAGMWIKIGGTGSPYRFANEANNTYARISGTPQANFLPLDHLPVGWAADLGTGKSIKVWVSDVITNGTTQISQTIEKAFLGQTIPVYIVNRGMVATQLTMNFEAKQKMSGSVTYMGMSGTESTATLDATPDAPAALASFPIFAGSVNVGKVYEGGAALTMPNCVRSLSFTINNNVTPVECIDSLGPGGITGHESTITGTVRTYFGTDSLLAKFYAATPTSITIAANKTTSDGTQAFIVHFPRVTYNGDGSPQASAKNQDIDLSLQWAAAKDEALTNSMIQLSRFEYVEL